MELRVLGVETRADGGSLDPEAGDLNITTGWGHAGKGGICMPGRGRFVERPYSGAERASIEKGAEALRISSKEALMLLGKTA